MMMEGAGFEVIDLGINNPVEKYLAALEEHKPDILGMSALLTTTMPYMKVVIDTMKEKGIRDDYIVLVGGAPLNEEFGKAVGADAYCRDAAVAVETAKALVACAAVRAGCLSAVRAPSRAVLLVDRLRRARRASSRSAAGAAAPHVDVPACPARPAQPARAIPAAVARRDRRRSRPLRRPDLRRLRRLRHRRRCSTRCWTRRGRRAPARRPLLRVLSPARRRSRRCTTTSPARST